MSNQARIDDMTMQIKVRIHPDRAPPPPDPRAARHDLRDPREVFFPPSRPPISVFYVAAATPPDLHALTHAPLSPRTERAPSRWIGFHPVSSAEAVRAARAGSATHPLGAFIGHFFPSLRGFFAPGENRSTRLATSRAPRTPFTPRDRSISPAIILDERREGRVAAISPLDDIGRPAAPRPIRPPLTRPGSPGSSPASCLFFHADRAPRPTS